MPPFSSGWILVHYNRYSQLWQHSKGQLLYWSQKISFQWPNPTFRLYVPNTQALGKRWNMPAGIIWGGFLIDKVGYQKITNLKYVYWTNTRWLIKKQAKLGIKSLKIWLLKYAYRPNTVWGGFIKIGQAKYQRSANFYSDLKIFNLPVWECKKLLRKALKNIHYLIISL